MIALLNVFLEIVDHSKRNVFEPGFDWFTVYLQVVTGLNIFFNNGNTSAVVVFGGANVGQWCVGSIVGLLVFSGVLW